MFDDDPRWGSNPRDRDDSRGRDPVDPRDVFLNHVDLPRTSERQLVPDRDREYALRDSESRTLSTVGAFRVVSSRDLTDQDGRQADPHAGDLRHLRDQGLIRTIPMAGSKDVAVVLTDRGRHLLEARRHDRDPGDRQEFYADLKKPREMEHDAQIYGAYLREAERLQKRGARIERVVLDYELKREYQQWLHERDRGHADADGRPRSQMRTRFGTGPSITTCPTSTGTCTSLISASNTRTSTAATTIEDLEILTVHYRGARGVRRGPFGLQLSRRIECADRRSFVGSGPGRGAPDDSSKSASKPSPTSASQGARRASW